MRSLLAFLKWLLPKRKAAQTSIEEVACAPNAGVKNDSPGAVTPPNTSQSTPLIQRKRHLDIYVGLDFGTSSTKAAYLELGGVTRVVRPVLFDHDLLTYPPYCLPSVGAIDLDRQFLWGAAAVRALAQQPWTAGIRRLKVLLAGGQDPAFLDRATRQDFRDYLERVGANEDRAKPEHIAAVALGLQMTEVRRTLERQYGGAELDIRFNVCAPIDHIESNAVLATYYRVLNVAQDLYFKWVGDRWSSNDLIEAATELYSTASPEERSSGRVFLVPESVAQVAAYLTSLEAESGVHAVLDLGAGTADISIFDLVKPAQREPVCYWYAASNLPRGTIFVERALAGYLKGNAVSIPTEEAMYHAILGLSRAKRDMLELVQAELENIRVATWRTWTDAYNHLRRQQDWMATPLFVCGGGSQLPGVKRVFSQPWVSQFSPHEVRSLPVPDDFDSLGGQVPFDRLSVAYGLAQPKPELGQYVLPKDSPDHTPPKVYRPIDRHWGDQPYPTDGWI